MSNTRGFFCFILGWFFFVFFFVFFFIINWYIAILTKMKFSVLVKQNLQVLKQIILIFCSRRLCHKKLTIASISIWILFAKSLTCNHMHDLLTLVFNFHIKSILCWLNYLRYTSYDNKTVTVIDWSLIKFISNNVSWPKSRRFYLGWFYHASDHLKISLITHHL